VSAPAAITFDVDGTPYDGRAVRRGFVWRNLRGLRVVRVGRRVREELRGRAFEDGAAYLAEEARLTAERLERTPEEVRSQLDELLGPRLCAVLSRTGPRPGVRATLEGLVADGVKIGAVSDYPVADKLEALGLADLPWAAMSAADQLGALKPHPRAFLAAVEALGASPGEVAHVGDRADTDVVGATEAGLRAVLLGLPGPAVDVPAAPDFAGAVAIARAG
jgi:HAD superfamily hydrolase (TIGR01509 family)